MTNTPISSQPPVSGPEYKPQDGIITPSGASSTTPSDSTAQSKDTLSKAEAQQRAIAALITTPELPSPQTNISLWDFLTVVGDTKLDFQHAMQDSDSIDQATRLRRSQALLYQTELVMKEYEAVNAAITDVGTQTADAVSELQTAFDQAEELVKAQNELTVQLEAGNAEEKKQFAAISEAYKTFQNGVKELKLSETGNGKDVGIYSLPLSPELPEGSEVSNDPELKDKYNKLAEDFNKAITTFNTYAANRLTEVNAYNAAVSENNVKATELNQNIKVLSEQYGFPLPKPVPIVNTRDTTIYKAIPLAEIANQVPANVKVYFPHPDSDAIGKNGLPKLGQLSYIAMDASVYKKTIYDQLYEEIVIPAEAQLNAEINQLAYQNIQASQPLLDSTPDPFSNRKSITQLLLPATVFDYAQKKNAGDSDSMLQVFGTGLQTEKTLARKATKQLIAEVLQNKEEKKANQLADKLLLLSLEQLSRQSRDALLPSIQQAGPALAALPKDNPLFSIVFALNFVKNIQRASRNGQTEQEINALIEKLPELRSLSPEQRQTLTAGITTGQLIVAGKFLESNLGLPGLFTNLLPTIFPTLQESTNQNSQTQLMGDLKTIFLDQGYTEEKAEFLAQTGSKGIYTGTLLAPPLSTITSSNINLPVLMESLTAAIILSPKARLSLSEAATLAEIATSRTLTEGPFKSTNGFRKILNKELIDLGLKEISSTITKQAILTPKAETTPTPDKLGDYLIPLITPQVGKKHAEDIFKEIGQVLQSLPKIIETQSLLLPPPTSNELLSEGLNNSLDLYSFLSILNNPASLFIYSLPTETLQQNKELTI